MYFIHLHRAARQGNVKARLQVGDAYHYGHYGIDVNYFQAAAEYSIIRKKIGQASYNLGYMHETGRGVRKSYLQASRFDAYRADQHSYYAIVVSLSRTQARMWFEDIVRQLSRFRIPLQYLHLVLVYRSRLVVIMELILLPQQVQ